MEELRSRLLPLKFPVALCFVVFLIAAVALGFVHNAAFGNASPDQTAKIEKALALELAILSAAFGLFLLILFDAIRSANRRLIGDFRREKRLNHAVAAAEEADRAKSAFLADISHELRTPLNTVIGFSEVMREQSFGPLGNQKYQDYAQDIHQSGRRMLSVITDLFDLSRVQIDQAEMKDEPLDLADCLETTAKMLSCQPEAVHLNFKFDFYPHLPRVMADRDAMRHILQNLLLNAIAHTKQGSIVVWANVAPGGAVEFGVTDTGKGIGEEQLLQIQIRFNQLDPSSKRKFEGTNLGLTMVNALMAAHDGRVSIDSDPGVGTTVTCHLPQRRVLLAADAKGNVVKIRKSTAL